MTDLWANHIAYWRKRAGMSQDELAAAIDPPTTKGTISQYESGKRKPSQDRLSELAKVLGRSPGDLLDGPPPVAGMPTHPIPVLGDVPAGNWREAIKQSRYSIPSPDPSVPASAYALKVVGDSMDRIASEGSTIVVDPGDLDLYERRLYVVRNEDGEVTFKQYLERPARLVPCSTNPAHTEIPVTSREFEIVGRVIWIAMRPDQIALA